MENQPLVAELKPGPVESSWRIRSAKLAYTVKGDAYLALTVGDRTGDVPAKIWQVNPALAEQLVPGAYVWGKGRVESYRNSPQVIIEEFALVAESEELRERCLAHPEPDPDELLEKLRGYLGSITDPELKRLADDYLADEEFMGRLIHWPAAKRNHHAYKHGLLEHVISVLGVGEALCAHYPVLDRDLVILGLFLHDSGKLVELVPEPAPGYSVEGQLLGHITIGVTEVAARCRRLEGFPDYRRVQLQHIILSHHESAAYGSPKPPMFPEAQIVHTIEMMDARLNAMWSELRKPAELSEETMGGVRFSRLVDRHLYTPPATEID